MSLKKILYGLFCIEKLFFCDEQKHFVEKYNNIHGEFFLIHVYSWINVSIEKKENLDPSSSLFCHWVNNWPAENILPVKPRLFLFILLYLFISFL